MAEKIIRSLAVLMSPSQGENSIADDWNYQSINTTKENDKKYTIEFFCKYIKMSG